MPDGIERLRGDLENEILRIANGSTNGMEKIRMALNSDDAMNCIFAMRAYALSGDRDDICIAALKRLKTDKGVWHMRVSDVALAALDISGVERYTGDNEFVKELIQTKFYMR